MVQLGVEDVHFVIGLIEQEGRDRKQAQRRIAQVLGLYGFRYLAFYGVASWGSDEQYPHSIPYLGFVRRPDTAAL